MISAWAELIGYLGNVTLNSLRIAASLERELLLTQELVRRKKVQLPSCMLDVGIRDGNAKKIASW